MNKFKKFFYNLLVQWAAEEEAAKDVPFEHKKEARKMFQSHVDKRIERGNIADPFGSLLAIMDNLNVSINIMTTKFEFQDEDAKRKVEEIRKNLVVSRRRFSIMMSDKFAESTYGKELSDLEELETIYAVFDRLYEQDDSPQRDIYLEEWAYDNKMLLDQAFRDLIEITSLEEMPVRPLLFQSMQPDVKIKMIKEGPGPSGGDPFGGFEGPEDGDEGPGESDYPDDTFS